MWDEKKFFEEYKTHMDEVEPDAKMKDKIVESIEAEEQHKVIHWQRYAASAAALVLCLGLGIYVWTSQLTPTDTDSQLGLQAGGEASTMISGTIGDTDRVEELQQAIDIVADESIAMTYEDGSELKELRRGQLLHHLESAKRAKGEPTGTYTRYLCEDETELEITIYDNGSITLSTTDIVFESK